MITYTITHNAGYHTYLYTSTYSCTIRYYVCVTDAKAVSKLLSSHSILMMQDYINDDVVVQGGGDYRMSGMSPRMSRLCHDPQPKRMRMTVSGGGVD